MLGRTKAEIELEAFGEAIMNSGSKTEPYYFEDPNGQIFRRVMFGPHPRTERIDPNSDDYDTAINQLFGF